MLNKIKTSLLSFKVMTAYLVLFFFSTIALFCFSIFLLDSGISKMEQERILPKIDSYIEIGEEEGTTALVLALRSQHGYNKVNNIFIHLTDANGLTTWLTVPQQLDDFPSSNFLPPDSIVLDDWQFFDLPVQNDLEVFSHSFDDGSTLFIGRTTERQEMLVESIRAIFFFVIIGIMLFGGAGGVVLAYQVLRPVRNLTKTVKEVSKGDMASRVPVSDPKGELDELAELVNNMLQRIETLVIAMRDALDNLGHDLRTPLTRMRTKIERTLIEEGSYEAQRETLMDCAEEIERINSLITMLMDIAEAETGQMRLKLEQFAAKDLLEDIAGCYEIIAEDRNITLSYEAEDIKITADRHRMAQALGNLTDNALKYTPNNGAVTLSAVKEGNFVILSVTDTGIGIPEEERERIFDKLYRLDKSRSEKGIGLGLSLVRAVVEAHEGTVTVSDAPKRGSIFSIRLPQ
ncbi:sensor histidine kinase [Halodesulfovibrio marinisediminis]|uniref:histidine kinase n=1 Tax=Halodesulfovibrio marinisediminis DSM 17456 TaxID=1121457 RepID=A0A1N6E858_9BACT|nr:ATP-binding protein [Halodesulfovibrio marinisediminis]SIN79214.1 Signal transduction histidine kinase [Halodesulfovibrio marinisediminis DSM 17456]